MADGYLNKDFVRGFALALADINRAHDCPTMVADVMRGHCYTIETLRRCGVDDYDLDEIRKCMPRRRKPSRDSKGGNGNG